MSKLLWHIYYGRIRPFERNFPVNPESIPWQKRYDEEIAYIESKLSEEDHKRLDKLLTAQNNLNGIEDEDVFEDGFCFGASVIMEILIGRERILLQADKPVG